LTREGGIVSEYRLSFYPWITQHVEPAKIKAAIEAFAQAVQAELQKATGSQDTIRVLAPLEVPQQVDAIATGDCEIALMNPLGLVFARRRVAAVNAVAVAQRYVDGKLGVSYFAQIYAAKRTALQKEPFDKLTAGTLAAKERAALVASLKPMSIAFGSPTSTSNFLIPAASLREYGLHPFTSFRDVQFAGGHDTAAIAVYEGRCDLGVGHDGAVIDLSHQYGYGDAAERLPMLWRSAPIPSDPIAVNISNIGTKQAIQSALIAAGQTSVGSAALSDFWGGVPSLAKTDSTPYAGLDQALQSLALRSEDILK